MDKHIERGKNMAKIMRQLDILSKNVMGDGSLSVYTMVVGCANFEEAKL